MAWDTSTVTLGETTKKSHYDRLRLNDQAIASGSFTFNGAKIWNGAQTFKSLLTLSATALSSFLIKSTKGIETPYAEFVHQENVNTVGGGSTSGAYRTLPDNSKNWTQKVNTITGLSVSTGVFTIPAGKYYMEADHLFWSCGSVKLIIYDTTNSTLIKSGENCYESNPYTIRKSSVGGYFELTGTTNIVVQYYVGSTKTTDGLGVQLNRTHPEIYGHVKIWKVG